VNHDPDIQPEDDDATDVEAHLFVPPEERGGGHPTGAGEPRGGRLDGSED
jgi:hypothetical protein